MRPAVYASVMRNRKTGARRISSTPHQFTWGRFFIMLFIGGVLFLPGLIVTVIGIESEGSANQPSDSVLDKFIGPASLACGVGLILAAGIYYCCWGFQSPVRTPHKTKHKKAVMHPEQYDPLQASSVPAISNHDSSRACSPGSPATRNGHHTVSLPTSPDQRSNRNNSHHHHARSSSKTSVDRVSLRSTSRHRSSSYSHHGNNGSNHSHHSSSHQGRHHTNTDNQVAFEKAEAPLAQGESGSISIDIDRIESDKKY